MNIYLVESKAPRDYGKYDSCVVIAEDEGAALDTHPSGDGGGIRGARFGEWPTDLAYVGCTLVGTATQDARPGVICASFTHG